MGVANNIDDAGLAAAVQAAFDGDTEAADAFRQEGLGQLRENQMITFFEQLRAKNYAEFKKLADAIMQTL